MRLAVTVFLEDDTRNYLDYLEKKWGMKDRSHVIQKLVLMHWKKTQKQKAFAKPQKAA